MVAAIGSLGALAMPLLVGADQSGGSIAFVATALAATAAILVWQRWDWLALGAFLVSAPQLLLWVNGEFPDHLVLAVAVLAGFWVLYVGAALGTSCVGARWMLPFASWALLFGSCAAFAGPAYAALDNSGHQTAAVALLFAFAALQVGLGIAAIQLRIHRELGSLLVGIGIALTAIGLGAALHGPALVGGWAAASVSSPRSDRARHDARPGALERRADAARGGRLPRPGDRTHADRRGAAERALRRRRKPR